MCASSLRLGATLIVPPPFLLFFHVKNSPCVLPHPSSAGLQAQLQFLLCPHGRVKLLLGLRSLPADPSQRLCACFCVFKQEQFCSGRFPVAANEERREGGREGGAAGAGGRGLTCPCCVRPQGGAQPSVCAHATHSNRSRGRSRLPGRLRCRNT